MFPPTVLAFLASLLLAISATPLADIGVARPDRVIQRATPTVTASVIATPRSGEYFGPIQIDGVNYTVLYDTGSAALWIKNGSSVAGSQFSTSYGSGRVNGTVTSGKVTAGGLTLLNQAYGVATWWDDAYDNYDGILGLDKSLTQFGGNATWVANAMPLYKQQVFAVNMPLTGSATFAFGYHDTAHEQGPLATNTDTYSSSQWYLRVTSFNIPANDTSLECVLDTGTTDILVPPSIAYGFWSQVRTATAVDGGERWTFPCADNATVPNFSVTIGGTKYTVAAADTYFPNTPSHGLCGSRLQGRKGSSNCILGQPFFYSNYVVYDFVNKSVGLTGRK
ncbi:acid protease [Xylariaceae sp. AK1471]|nr:acid protease [Xylariaceae sp. AK1471]